MATVEKSIEVHVPLTTAYNQWTQFEEFPRFMEGVQEVRQLDDEHLYWVAEVGGQRKEWRARITRQVPDEVIAWESEGGTENNGIVTFHRVGDDRTEVMLQMDYDPESAVENVGDKLGFVSRRVEGDLKRFKEFIEERGRETGGWRGEIAGGQTQTPPHGGTAGMTGGTGSERERYGQGHVGQTGPGYTGGQAPGMSPEGRTERAEDVREGGTRQGGTNYGGSQPGRGEPGTPGTPDRPL
jgi:hypothetical protein